MEDIFLVFHKYVSLTLVRNSRSTIIILYGRRWINYIVRNKLSSGLPKWTIIKLCKRRSVVCLGFRSMENKKVVEFKCKGVVVTLIWWVSCCQVARARQFNDVRALIWMVFCQLIEKNVHWSHVNWILVKEKLKLKLKIILFIKIC